MRSILTTAKVIYYLMHMQVSSLVILFVLMYVHAYRNASYRSDRNPALAVPAPVWFGSDGNVCGSAV